MNLFFAAMSILICSGILAIFLYRRPAIASWVGAGGATAGCLAGMIFASRILLGHGPRQVTLSWHVPVGGLVFACDSLSAWFLLPAFGLGALAALYGREYLLAYGNEKNLGTPWFAYNLLIASMAAVVTARHAVMFLVAWEIMSLASFVLIVFEHEQPAARRAGWVYLIAAHTGTLFLIALFLVLESATGTLVLGQNANAVSETQRSVVLLLAFIGFGVKAGLLPMHVWLPEAHAAAPSHVSAVMSGVVIKMGVYGLVRISLAVGPTQAWWGLLLVCVGLLGALYGITLANTQRDIKRILAYSSIENVGLVMIGLGLAFWGRAAGHPVLGALALCGGLLHVWNHTAMKGLLFLGAGTIVHETGTKDVERLGGLMQRAPFASSLLIVGAVAIAGLPALNGFVGEWLLYRSLLEGAMHAGPAGAVVFMSALGVLSIVGAIAALCFLRLCSVALLGSARSDAAASAREPSLGMTLPMAFLALFCVAVGVRPTVLFRALHSVISESRSFEQFQADAALASLAPIGHVSLFLWGLCALMAIAIVPGIRLRTKASDATWGCGYTAPTARMQYTAHSFGQIFAGLLPRRLRARIDLRAPSGLFPSNGRLTSDSTDPFTSGIYEPAIFRIGERFAQLRWLQQGAVHIYLLYILIAVLAGLAWSSLTRVAG